MSMVCISSGAGVGGGSRERFQNCSKHVLHCVEE